MKDTQDTLAITQVAPTNSQHLLECFRSYSCCCQNHLRFHLILPNLKQPFDQIVHSLLILMNAQWLSRENRKLKEENSALKNKTRCLQDDESTQKQISQRLQQSNSKLQEETKSLRTKIQIQKANYQEKQKQYEFVIRKIEEQLIEKSQQFQRLQAKVAPLLDTDSVRLKVLNQFEYPHRLQIEEKDLEIEQLKQDSFSTRRKIQQLLIKLETQQLQHDRSIRDIKARHKIESDNARIDIESLRVADAVRSSHHQMESLLKHDVEYYQQCYIKSQQALQTLRQQTQKHRDQHDSKIRQLVESIGSLQRQNNRLKEGSVLRDHTLRI